MFFHSFCCVGLLHLLSHLELSYSFLGVKPSMHTTMHICRAHFFLTQSPAITRASERERNPCPHLRIPTQASPQSSHHTHPSSVAWRPLYSLSNSNLINGSFVSLILSLGQTIMQSCNSSSQAKFELQP